MLLILASVLANYFLISDSRVYDLAVLGNFWSNLTFIFGLLCYLSGVIILGLAFFRLQPLRGWLEYSLLTILTLSLPVVLMMPLMMIFSLNFNALDPFEWFYSFPSTLITLLGFAWVFLSAWLVSHQNSRNGSHNELQLV
jgi:hypothetical protein